MKASLDHLSVPKRAQLSRAVELLRDPATAVCDDRIVQLAEAADAA